MRNKILISILLIVIIVEVFLSFSGNINSFFSNKSKARLMSVPDTLSGQSIFSERNRFSKLMDEVGVEEAYIEFKNQYQNKNFGVQHTMSHVVGELIYEKNGLEGMSFCDSTFAFGCYHSFYSLALADKGLSIIETADKYCIDKFGPLGTGCQHGIGHGLMGYYGPEKLELALDACGKTTQVKKLFGCTSGVFMEYNVPIVISPNNAETVPRVLDKNNPYSPCPSVKEQYQESCYYEMPQWWEKGNAYNKDYKKIGELCEGLNSPAKREACFLGVGNVSAPSSNYVVADTVSKCEQMPTRESETTCRSGASWSFFSSVTYRDEAIMVCKDLDEVSQNKCVKDSDLIGNKLQ